MPDRLVVARAALHMWEEPCISGEEGSGTVFFSGCNLKCVFCQNYNIAAGKSGKEISTDRLVEIFFELKEKKANNINLVTPSHYVKQIVTALEKAKNMGLDIPVVYNTSSYEKTDTIKMLDGLIDIYLPDFKYIDSNLSFRYSNASDYYNVASKALEEMHRQVPHCVFDNNGMMKSGIIVRHLILPGCVADSKNVIKYLHDTYGNDIYISIMNQYTPIKHFDRFKELNQTITEKDYDEIIDYALDLGIKKAFIQEGGTDSLSFIPDFSNQNLPL